MRHAFAIARREWKELARDYYVSVPVLVVPLFLTGLLCFVVLSVVGYYALEPESLERFVVQMPRAYDEILTGFTPYQKVILMPIRIFGIPLFLFIPLVVTGILSADSFAGEKERSTLEPLLLSPVTEWELFAGKLLACAVPAVAASWISLSVFTAVVLRFVSPHFDTRVFPDASWMLAGLVVVPLLVVLSVTGAILVSSRLSTTRAAMQVNTIFTLPLLGVLFAQLRGVFFFTPGRIAYTSLALAAAVGLSFAGARRLFRRERLLQ